MLLFTGALTSKPYAFTARPWELRSVQSIDILDGVGSNIRVDFKETEILRILPRRNPEINESWISDKTRFFYDGLKRQRLNSPYMKIRGEFKKVRWSKVLKNLTSVLKVYSFEFGNSRIGMILGTSSDSETFFAARDLSLNMGFANLGVDREYKLNLDSPNTYCYRGEFKDLEDVDFCLFVGTNPRFEASVLNVRLRKIFRRGDLKTASIGGNFSTMFPVEFMGLTSRTLMDFVEGRHPVCKSFAKAKKPLIIYGASVMTRLDALGLSNMFHNLCSNFAVVFEKVLFTNPLHIYSNIVGAFELGIKPINVVALNYLKVVYAIGVDNGKLFKSPEFKKFPIFIFQGSHGVSSTSCADFVMPSTTFVEKDTVYYNMEGRPQKTQRALVGPNLARDDWKILRVLFSYLKKSVFYNTHSQLTGEVSKILPSIYFSNSWFEKRETSVSCFSLSKPFIGERVYFSYFKLTVEDFYMTGQICQSSRIMAKASQHLRSYFHNYKFMS